MNRDAFQPGPLADVACEAAAGRWTLVFVRELRHQPDDVWDALTDPARLDQWAPFAADRHLGTIGDATLTMIDGDTAEDLPATVTRAERPAVLEYEWGKDRLRWELEPTAAGTRLTLRHTLDDRPWVPSVAAGWHLCLDVAGHLLDGTPVGVIRGDEARQYGWEALRDAYAERLGISVTDEDPPAD
jgi:uncharacterized protein YndB with AHSA1/START domain